MSWPAIFLDKDGTLLHNVPYNIDVDMVKLASQAMAGLKVLAKAANYKFIVITNQQGLAHGYFREEDLGPVHDRLEVLFEQQGLHLSGFYYCGHHPQAHLAKYRTICFCRKPSPGLVLKAAEEHDIDLSLSWFVGDILDDVECGRRAGCRTILIDNGHETEWRPGPYRKPHAMAGSIKEAAAIILKTGAMERSEWAKRSPGKPFHLLARKDVRT